MTDKTILRVEHNSSNPYMMMERVLPKNKQLSYEALGMMVYLLSQPDDWEVMPVDLQRVGCGRDKVYRILNELADAGHIEYVQARAGTKFSCGRYNVYERPMPNVPHPEKPDTVAPGTSPPRPENPDPASPDAGQRDDSPPFPEKPDAVEQLENGPVTELPYAVIPSADLPDTGSPVTAKPTLHSSDSLEITDSDSLQEGTEPEVVQARENAAAPADMDLPEIVKEGLHEREDKAIAIFDYYVDNKFSPPLDNDILRTVLADAANEYTPEQIKFAFTQAVEYGARQWSYVKTILVRLKTADERAEMVRRQTKSLSSPSESPTRHMPDVPEEIDAAWTAAYGQLKAQLDRGSFNTYLRESRLIGYEAGTSTLVIAVRNGNARDMLQHRLYRSVRRVVSDVLRGQSVSLRFEVSTRAPLPVG